MKWTEIRPRVFEAEDGTLQDGSAAHPWRSLQAGDSVCYLNPLWQAYEDGYAQGCSDGSGEGYGLGKDNPHAEHFESRTVCLVTEAEFAELVRKQQP